MTGDQYLQGIISKYSVNVQGAKVAANLLIPVIKRWAGSYLIETVFSGSFAKGTFISLSTDADIFISLSSQTPNTLREIFNNLYNAVTEARYTARKQNVSIRVIVNSYKVDLVPGKRQSQYGNDHSLYRNKANTWTQTNINTHVSYVVDSKRISEIKLAKIWRELHKLDFPSFYLEMAVIDSLKYVRSTQLSERFMKVLIFFSEELTKRRYVDPANTNNIISDDLSTVGKMAVSVKATQSKGKPYWEGIVW